MRRLHIKEFSKLCQTLETAIEELEKQKGDTFLDLCAQTQKFVSVMFDFAETTFGQDTRISELLKELYETLYYVSREKKQVKQLKEMGRELKNEAGKLKADQMEVVFFCYKASMSDALESVYFAAKADPCCNAYFIPIPYFDRNPDGSFGQMHLEGEGFYPDRYELTDWRAYDVQARRPEAIFIMNPYDEGNYVTSVYPDFYSSRLKKYTDNLVYIEYGLPYWLCRDPYERAAQKEIARGVVLPAHLHAHTDIRYAKELAEGNRALLAAHPETAGRCRMTPEKIREKFVALGSPKFDKVLHTSREDSVLPHEWREKTAGKKVVLYNTSLTELLKASARQAEADGDSLPGGGYFGKVRSILEAFRECDEAVLWWRPHPLFETTLRSMRPGLWREYVRMAEAFKASGRGIFDDTENLHRAIAWSDGMISDESSLLLLYMATGKPFYIPSITKALARPVYDDGEGYQAPLSARLENMRAAKGANVGNWNCCIWWDNFLEEDIMHNTHFNGYVHRFLDFVLHPEKYPQAGEYRQRQIQMLQDVVVNADGTAGQKIYEFVKQKALAQGGRV